MRLDDEDRAALASARTMTPLTLELVAEAMVAKHVKVALNAAADAVEAGRPLRLASIDLRTLALARNQAARIVRTAANSPP